MGMMLAAMVQALTEDVPAVGDVPTDAQQRRAVIEAVTDFNGHVSATRHTQIAVVDGTAIYDLPADFMSEINLSSLTTTEDVMVTGAGLVPVSAQTQQQHYYDGDPVQLIFVPTPTFSITLDLFYQAGHFLNSSDEYPDMNDRESEVILWKAQATILRKQANVAAAQAIAYGIGDERYDKKAVAAALREQAAALERTYQDAVKAMKAGTEGGPAIGMRSKYAGWTMDDLFGRDSVV